MADQTAQIATINKKIASLTGKSHGFPGSIKYEISPDGKIVTTHLLKNEKNEFRQFDPWTLAFIDFAENDYLRSKITNIVFQVSSEASDAKNFAQFFEAFKRRVSFLAINNTNRKFTVNLDSNPVKLYDKKSLFTRPKSEIVRPDEIKDRQDNKPGPLEKMFQTFLYEATNERLAIISNHFMGIKKKHLQILREYPTGVFNKQKNKENRILMTDFVDLVSINKYGCLSVIELKVDGNSPLELVSQILDYALFFACYKDRLLVTKTFKPLAADIRKQEISCYAVANYFHPRFDSILPYYRTGGKYNFELYKVILGYTTEFKQEKKCP